VCSSCIAAQLRAKQGAERDEAKKNKEKPERNQRKKSLPLFTRNPTKRLKGAVFTQVLHWARAGCVLEKLSDKR
jgi:hypothetical protein